MDSSSSSSSPAWFINSTVVPDTAPTPPSPPTSSDLLSPGQQLLLSALLGLELCASLLCLPISAVNFCVIHHTRIIHRNLRFVLLCQCLAVVLYAALRIVELIRRLVAPSAGMLFGLFSLRVLIILFGDWLGLTLLCERIMATLSVRSYEHNHRPYFRICSLGFTAGISLCCYLVGIDRKSAYMVSRKAHPEIYAALVCGLVCTVLWLLLYRYNIRAYARSSRLDVHDLSERYQLSENIRTFRQLLPTVVLHFFNSYLTIGSSLLMSSDLITDRWVATLCATLIFVLFSISNLVMQITVIIFHPILNRKAHRMLCTLRPYVVGLCVAWQHRNNGNNNNSSQHAQPNRVHSETTLTTMAMGSEKQHVPKDIYGADLVREAQMQEHFQMLAQWWQVESNNGMNNLKKNS